MGTIILKENKNRKQNKENNEINSFKRTHRKFLPAQQDTANMPSYWKAIPFLTASFAMTSSTNAATTTTTTVGGDTDFRPLVRNNIKSSKKQGLKNKEDTCTIEQFLGTSQYSNCKRMETEVKIVCDNTDDAATAPTKKMCSYSEQPVLFDEDGAAAAEKTAGCGDHGFFDPETQLTRDHATGLCRLKFFPLTSTCIGAPVVAGGKFGVMVEVPPTGTGTGPGAHKNPEDNSGLLLRFSYDAGLTYNNYKDPRNTVPLGRSSPRRQLREETSRDETSCDVCAKSSGTFDSQKDYCYTCGSGKTLGYCWNSQNPQCPPACDNVQGVSGIGDNQCGEPCDEFLKFSDAPNYELCEGMGGNWAMDDDEYSTCFDVRML